MRSSNVSVRRRIAAGIMGLMLLVIVLFSAFYISAEVDHDCTGENCPICVCIQQCENTLRGIGDGVSASVSVIIPFIFVMFTAAFYVTAVSHDTLISRKVRLNN